MILKILICLICTTTVLNAKQINDNFQNDNINQAFNCGLNSIGAGVESLKFKKSWHQDPYRLKLVKNVIDDPIKIVDLSNRLAKADQTQLIKILLNQTSEKTNKLVSSEFKNLLIRSKQEISQLYSETVSNQTELATDLMIYLNQFQNNPNDFKELIQIGGNFKQLEKNLKLAQNWQYEEAELLYKIITRLKKIPKEKIYQKGLMLKKYFESISLEEIKQLKAKDLEKVGIKIASEKNDLHTNQNYWCIIDLGGNDIYEVGYASPKKPLSIIIDYSGNDRYANKSLGGIGSSILGVSLVIDHQGNDIYESQKLAQGATVGGLSILEDKKGNDIYRCVQYGQGMALFGLGMLIDSAGNDTYLIGAQGQGFGFVEGIGILLDESGNDIYSAGNLRKDLGRYSDRYVTLSQGVGMGIRPYASGGIGILSDKSGCDKYSADVFGQGVGYWLGAGFLLDSGGDDSYQMYEYGQGAGIHIAFGVLQDEAGNDLYTLRNGIGQGSAHDYAIGYLRDKRGNDQYQGRITVQGSAIFNGIGLFIEDEGDDWYSSLSNISQGYGRFEGRRDFGSLGFCIDGQGHDIYHDKKRNDFVEIRANQGVSVDYPTK